MHALGYLILNISYHAGLRRSRPQTYAAFLNVVTILPVAKQIVVSGPDDCLVLRSWHCTEKE